MKVYLYVVTASPNPDFVECVVPFKVGDLIFFGPCKRRIRKKFYKIMKEEKSDCVDISDREIYIIGVNGSNSKKIRKVIWAGKVTCIMTFERAFNEFINDKRFKEMIECKHSPLIVKPIYDVRGNFIGYERRSGEHKDNNVWVEDITGKKYNSEIIVNGDKLLLKNPSRRWEILTMDCCFICENIFFAEGKGIDIDEDIINILKIHQKEKKGIDNYNIFGKRKDGSADGRTGSYLPIGNENELAKKLMLIIRKKANEITEPPGENRALLELCRGKGRSIC